jgi:hypothetical protein
MVKRLTSDDRIDKSRGFAPAERNVEGEPVGPSFEGVLGEGTLSRRRMLGLAGGALTGLLLTPLTLSGGEASANQVSSSLALANHTYEIRQNSTRRFLDAYTYPVAIYNGDYRAVTRTDQDDDTQRWLLIASGPPGYYRIRQKKIIDNTYRYLDAYTTSNQLNAVVTNKFQNNTEAEADTQRWRLTVHDDIMNATLYFRIRNKSNGGYLDAYTSSPKTDYRVVTNTKLENTEREGWLLKQVA